jgi:hypothetical protein
MKKPLLLLLAASPLALFAVARADIRSTSIPEVVNKLNGSPKYVGYVDAGPVSQHVVVTGGRPHMAYCELPAFVLADIPDAGVGVSGSIRGEPVATGEKVYLTTQARETRLYFIAADAGHGCWTYELK